MATKAILKHGNNYVPTINDDSASKFGGYETYSRKKLDSLLGNNGGYDWSEKLVVFEGDSITGNTAIAYPDYVAEQIGCEISKVALSGFCLFGDYEGRDVDYRRRVSNYPSDADAIVILGDVNSSLFVTPSSVAGTIDSADDSTWFGRYNLALEAIKKSFPTVPVFLVAEYNMGGDKEATSYAVSSYYPQLAKKWGCILIDLPTECPLDLKYTAPKYGLTSTDKVHCSHAAMPLFADVIIRKLREIPPCDWVNADTLTMTTTELTVAAGATAEIEYTITGDLSIQWTSDNMDVACVMGGVVYGMSVGTATITAKTRNGNTATCTVTVTE